MPVIPPGFAHVIIPHTHTGLARSAVITFGIVPATGVPDPAEPDAILAGYSANMTNDNQVTVGPVTVVYGQDGGENVTLIGTDTDAGTSSSDRVPSNVAVLVTKSTTRGGRKGKGRLFLPWRAQEDEVDELGIIGNTYLAGIQSECDDWLANLSINDRPMQLLHSSGTFGDPNEVVALTVNRMVGTQRRRLGR